MEYKDIIEKVFTCIETEYDYFNVKINNKNYGNGYYLFEMGDNSVCHFTVKGLKRWLFGIWVQEEKSQYKIYLFGEHKDYIDKFKPSATSISRTFYWNPEKDINEDIDIYCFTEEVSKILNAPVARKFQYYGGNESLIHFICRSFWNYRIVEPLKKFRDKKLALLYVKFISVLYTAMFKRKNNNYHTIIKDKGAGWLPRYDLYMVYDKCDDDYIYDVYHFVERKRPHKNIVDGTVTYWRKTWLVPQWVLSNCHFNHCHSDDNLRGFYYEEKEEE